MTTPWKLRPGSINLTAGAEADLTETPPETPFRLLVLGNFSGNTAKATPFSQRKPILIDRDNFDDVLSSLAPNVTLQNQTGADPLTINFSALDDFEPDRLYRNLPVFEELRTLQDQVGNNATFQKAADKIRVWAKLPDPEAPLAPKADVSAAEVLEQLLEADRAHTAADDWQVFLRKIAQPHLIEKPDPRQADYAVVVEQAIGAQMRTILHHPAFQALEAAWRSVYLLTNRLPTDSNLQVHILDATLDELHADVGREDLRGSVFVQEVISRATDKPWAGVICLETFGKSIADLELLASLVMLSARSRTPILAGAAPSLFGCTSLREAPEPRDWKPNTALAAAWDMIRGMEASKFLGLVTPRFLLRLPYGKNATEIESFAFEEMPTLDHEAYLWASGAVLCGLLLAEAYVESGWQLPLDEGAEVHCLPVHIFREDGEACMKPCAEVLMRQSALEALIERGLMALTSLRDRDGVRLHRFQSAAHGNQQIAGRW